MSEAVERETTIRRVKTSEVNRVYTWGMLGLIPVAAGGVAVYMLFGEDVARTVYKFALPAAALVYIVLINRAITPAEQRIRVIIDASGVRSGKQWLARADEIVAAHVCRPSDGATVKGVNAPAWPWSVYILTRRDPFWLLVTNEAQGRRIVESLGLPVEVRDLANIAKLPE